MRENCMKSHFWAIAAALPPEDEPSALDNNSRNQQEHQNTAAEPAGPRETTPPGDMANE
jgi:hypothetical protein